TVKRLGSSGESPCPVRNAELVRGEGYGGPPRSDNCFGRWDRSRLADQRCARRWCGPERQSARLNLRNSPIRGSIQIQSPRLFSEASLSARMSKGVPVAATFLPLRGFNIRGFFRSLNGDTWPTVSRATPKASPTSIARRMLEERHGLCRSMLCRHRGGR